MSSTNVPKMIRKGIGVANDKDPTKTTVITVDDSSESNTSTVIVAQQTEDRTLTLPDADGTLATTADIAALTTDDIPEGSTNEYFTEERVLETPLTGYDSEGSTLDDTDTVLEAFEKLDAEKGDVTGPNVTYDGEVAVFSGTTGKEIKKSSFTIDNGIIENKILDNSSNSNITLATSSTPDPSYSSGSISISTGSTANPNLRGSIVLDAREVILAGPAITPTNDNSIATKKYVDDNSGGGGSGDVTGPPNSLTNEIPVFADTTGKVIKKSSLTIDNGTISNVVAGESIELATRSNVLGSSGALTISTGEAGSSSGDILIETGPVSGDPLTRGEINLNAQKVILDGPAVTPTENNSVATKKYVDEVSGFLSNQYVSITSPIDILDISNDSDNTKIDYNLNLETKNSGLKFLIDESVMLRNITYSHWLGTTVEQIAQAPDGDLIFAGYSGYGAIATPIFKTSPDGREDTVFNNNVASYLRNMGHYVYKIYPTEDYLYFSIPGYQIIGRFDWQGNHDYKFYENTGIKFGGAYTEIKAIKQVGNKIIIGGTFESWAGIDGYDHCVVLFSNGTNADGGLSENDTLEVSGGGKFQSINYTPVINAIEVDLNGKIWIGGLFEDYGSVAGRDSIIRLNSDFSIDSTYCSSYLDNSNVGIIVYDIKVDSLNQIVYTRSETNTPVCKMLNNAGIDTTFELNIYNDTSLVNSTITKILIRKDNRILLGGNFNHYQASLVLLNTDGTQNYDFMYLIGINPYGFDINDMVFFEDENLLYCGTTTVIDSDGLGRVVKIQLDKNIYTLHGTLYITTDKAGKVRIKDTRHAGNGFVGKFIHDAGMLKFVPRDPNEMLTGTIKTRLLKTV